MHLKILERRKAVFMEQAVAGLEYISPEDEEQALAEWVSHYEGKLPRPENYRKKTLPHLRKLLGRIDHNLELVSKPTWGYMGERLSAMYQAHRGYIVKELHRRMMVKKA
jgi:hypothetical protein